MNFTDCYGSQDASAIMVKIDTGYDKGELIATFLCVIGNSGSRAILFEAVITTSSITSSVFINNKVTQSGGSLIYSSAKGLVITSCIFSGTTFDSAAVRDITFTGTAASSVVIIDSVFTCQESDYANGIYSLGNDNSFGQPSATTPVVEGTPVCGALPAPTQSQTPPETADATTPPAATGSVGFSRSAVFEKTAEMYRQNNYMYLQHLRRRRRGAIR
jgi:hypothetical protein